MLYGRFIKEDILKSLCNNPVVLINGARQVGKSTLIEQMIEEGAFKGQYLSLDDYTILFASSNDPFGFLSKYNQPLALDEVQRNPDLFVAIKRIVDTKKEKGQFLLTGSANVLTLPKVSESLAGRMVIHTLWPLSEGEIQGKKGRFIDWAFGDTNFPHVQEKLNLPDLITKIVKGGYPRSLMAEDHRDRREWMKSYLDTILQRDIMSLAKIEGLKDLPHIISIVAERIGNLLNIADIGRITGLNKVTLKRYYTLLQMVFLVTELPAWFPNRDKRLSKSPKVYVNDTGIACYFKNLTNEDFLTDRVDLGPLLENFCVMELKKQITWQEDKPDIFHFRTQAGREVDIVLEGRNKNIVGIEIKSSTSIGKSDLSGFKTLKEIAGKKFVKGIILYTGEQVLSFGDELYALPIQALWGI